MCKLLTRILRFLNERFSAVTAPLMLHRMYFVLLWHFHQSVALIEHKSWQVDSRPIFIGACSVVLKKERRLSQPWQRMVSHPSLRLQIQRHRTDSTEQYPAFGNLNERANNLVKCVWGWEHVLPALWISCEITCWKPCSKIFGKWRHCYVDLGQQLHPFLIRL